MPPDPGEFVATKALADILMDLRERSEFILIDVPPILAVGDAVALSAKLDGIVLVTQLNRMDQQSLRELTRVLHTAPAVKLGYVVTGARKDHDYFGADYGYGGGSARRIREPTAR